jgi:ABC-type multidrug transport system fused ATPase/permease subunit
VIFGSSVGQLAELITNLSILVALGYGAMKIAAGVITVGELVAFLSFYGYLFSSVGNFITLNVEVQGALGSVERVFALMDLPPEGEPAAPAIRTAPPRRLECDRLSFEQVTFRYGDEGFQLQDISFEVCRGESYALVGRTGSGKSTLASLIPRFFEPQEGAIRLGGTDLRHIELGALRDRIAFLTHTPTIFSGTIRDNITFGRRWIDPPAVETVARMAEIHEFIQSLPGGYEAELGERGLKLSLGQAQRIALARALLKAPEIVIFDEATSGLDSACERTIMERLAVLFRNCIVLNISHRLFSVQNATRILLLEDGRLVDAGSHEDLITTSPVYRELCKRQLIKSERQTLVTPLG